MIAASNGEKKNRKRRSSEKAEEDSSSGDAGDEETAEHSKSNKRGRKGTGFDTNKERRSFNKMNLDEENTEAAGGDDRPKSSGEDRETGETETFRFPPDQRTIDVVTPEALILCLYYGSGVLLIKSDEFKVINKVLRCLK